MFYRYLYTPLPTGIHLLKVGNRNTRRRCKICSKLTIKTLERRHWCCSNFVISNFVRVFLLLTLNMLLPVGLALPNDWLWIKAKSNECVLKLWPKYIDNSQRTSLWKKYVSTTSDQISHSQPLGQWLLAWMVWEVIILFEEIGLNSWGYKIHFFGDRVTKTFLME